MGRGALIGRYFPAQSPIHALDPRAKALMTLAVIIIAFLARTFEALAVCAAFIAGCIALARIPWTQAVRSVAPLMFMVVLTALANLLFVQGGPVCFAAGPIVVTEAGVRQALFFGVRLTLLLFAASLLTLTTTSLDITEATGRLLAPAARVGVPAHELSMMMGIALRFLPQLSSEFSDVRNAQVSRGATFARGGPAKRLGALGALVVPLFASTFRHAETLAGAMEARCYHGGEGRTRLHPLSFGRGDVLGACAIAALFMCVMGANALTG